MPGGTLRGPEALGRAAGWFPLVGLAIGAVLALEERAASLLFPPLLSALVVLATWKLLTGGIHLDGLADSLDGLKGRDRVERLAIMRDGRIGVFGALGVTLLLLLDFGALAEVRAPLRTAALLLAPAVGRVAPLLLARTLRPATPGDGSGAAFMGAVRLGGLAVGGSVLVIACAAVLWPWGLVAATVGLAIAWTLGRYLAGGLGGLSGDGLGAGIEVAELGVLLVFAFVHRWSLA